MPGYLGENCSFQCPYPAYGKRCQGTCVCDKDMCDISTGCKIRTGTASEMQLINVYNPGVSVQCLLCSMYSMKMKLKFSSVTRLSFDLYLHSSHATYVSTEVIFRSDKNSNTIYHKGTYTENHAYSIFFFLVGVITFLVFFFFCKDSFPVLKYIFLRKKHKNRTDTQHYEK